MPDNTSLEQFSVLDVFPSVTPVWRPFVEPRNNARSQEVQREAAECAQ